MQTCREWFKGQYGKYPEEVPDGLGIKFPDMQFSWNAALKAAGVEIPAELPASEFIKELQDAIASHGDFPMYREKDGLMMPLAPGCVSFVEAETIPGIGNEEEELPARFVI